MAGFILILIISIIVGLQMGIYAVLNQKGISGKLSFLYSSMIYFMPIVIISSHKQLYKERHRILDYIKKDSKYNNEDLLLISYELNSKRFMWRCISETIKDLFKPKDNIIVFLNVIVSYEKERVVKVKKKVNVFEKLGLVGAYSKIVKLITSSMKDHVREENADGFLYKKYAI